MIFNKVKLDFVQHPEGTTFINQGDRCDRLVYVLDGCVCVDRHVADNAMLVSEYTEKVPMVIEPHNLYGMYQKFEHSYTFVTPGSTFCIDKQVFASFILDFKVVRTNMLNIICTRAQHLQHHVRENTQTSIEGKLKTFLVHHCSTYKGKKMFRVRMIEVADMINETRLNVSRILNKWQDMGLIHQSRGKIIIEDMEMFLTATK